MARLKTLKPRLKEFKGRQLQTIDPNSWRNGKTTAERGYGYKWQKARERFLAKHPLCAHCQAKGLVVAANEVDHVVPHRGNEQLFWDEDNWQPLCRPCHSSKTQRETAEGL